jgi:hypothetical protein
VQEQTEGGGDMRVSFGLVFVVFFVTKADASCACRCVDGEVQPLCSSSIDLPPVCGPTVCSLISSSIAPIQPTVVPPLGTSSCSQRQVLNPATRRYEWQSICN